jgi:hypothetical protein
MFRQSGQNLLWFCSNNDQIVKHDPKLQNDSTGGHSGELLIEVLVQHHDVR